MRSRQHLHGTPTVTYFNKVFFETWRLFIDEDMIKLGKTGSNTTMDMYPKRGLDPLTSFCEGWERAIKILGSLTNKSCMHYEPIEKPNMHLLSLEGERMLQG
jgi:hypothetical protein